MDRNVFPLDTVGAAINDKFISIKVQLDSANNDSKNIKKYYSLARNFEKTYDITALPTYLFFSPKAELVHKATGFHDVENFIGLIKDVQMPGKQLDMQLVKDAQAPGEQLNTEKKQLHEEIKACREGKMDVNLVPAFIRRLNDAKENVIALELARQYMKNYLEGLPEARFSVKENLQLMWDFQQMSKTEDRIYKLLCEKPKIINNTYDNAELADMWIGNILNMEYVFPVLKSAQQTKKEPDWKSLSVSLVKKAEGKHAENILVDAKHIWYCTIKDWDKACDYEIIKFQRRDLKKLPEDQVCPELNTIAWKVFLYSFNKKQLEQGLSWIDEAIVLDENKQKPSAMRMDTKANLLYKLGRKAEAIALQEKTVMLYEREVPSKKNNTPFHIALNKMRRGEPTWDIGVKEKRQVK
jgi:hypothetical protein